MDGVISIDGDVGYGNVGRDGRRGEEFVSKDVVDN